MTMLIIYILFFPDSLSTENENEPEVGSEQNEFEISIHFHPKVQSRLPIAGIKKQGLRAL